MTDAQHKALRRVLKDAFTDESLRFKYCSACAYNDRDDDETPCSTCVNDYTLECFDWEPASWIIEEYIHRILKALGKED